jgi:sugar phosphate isomerase/epimerase
MKFAVCSEVFGNKKWEDVCAFCAKTGFDGIEVASISFAQSVNDIKAADRARILKTAKENGLNIPALHMLMSPPSMGMHINSPDEAVRKKTVDYLKAVIDFAKDLEAGTIIYGSPFSRNVAAPLDYKQARAFFKEGILQAMDHAKQAKVTVCIEPLPADCTDLCTSVEGAFGLVCDVNHPNFGLMIDCKAASNDVRPVDKTIRLFGPYIKHVHTNDPTSKAAGFGTLDYKPIMKALKEINYQGIVSLEPFKYEPDPETVASVSLKYLKFCMAG